MAWTEFHDNGVAYGAFDISTSYSTSQEKYCYIEIAVYGMRADYNGASDGNVSVSASGWNQTGYGPGAIIFKNGDWVYLGTWAKWCTTDASGNASINFYAQIGVRSPSAGWKYSSKTLTSVSCGTPPRLRFTVSYNANGGSGAPSAQTKTKGVSLTLSSTKPSRTGYNFKGWATSSTSTTVSYSAGGTYSTDADITLYAVWQKKTYSVSYNANGGSGAPSAQTKTYGTDLTLSGTKPSRTGYTFKEWNTQSNGSGTAYAPGAKYTSNAALTLYAVWTINTWQVSYNANGGTGAPGRQTKTYGVTLTLSSSKPTKTGYSFKEWNTKVDGSGTAYSAGGSYTANAAATLYAIWTVNQYTIKFNANGGYGAMSDQVMTYDKSANLTANKFTWAGRTFHGWATSSTGAVVYENGASVSNLVSSPGGSITLYAVWSINKITITFDAASNEGFTSETSRTIDYGASLVTLPIASRPYYAFTGWFTAKTGGTQITATRTFTVNTTLYAQFVIDSSVIAKIAGVWKKGIPYIKVNGEWKKGYAWVNVNGSWKQGIG